MSLHGLGAWDGTRPPDNAVVKRGLGLLLLLVELSLLLGGGVLVLLVLRDKIVHVGLGLSELHLVHSLTGVPVQEGLPSLVHW